MFSSSTSLYNVVPGFKVTEDALLKPSSLYAFTKYMIEMVLQDFCNAYGIHGIALRYFNPIGADPSEEALFNITGVNLLTRDGLGIRDYIHVWDLAMAHVEFFEKLNQLFAYSENLENAYLVINLGTGNGVMVKELVAIFEDILRST